MEKRDVRRYFDWIAAIVMEGKLREGVKIENVRKRGGGTEICVFLFKPLKIQSKFKHKTTDFIAKSLKSLCLGPFWYESDMLL